MVCLLLYIFNKGNGEIFFMKKWIFSHAKSLQKFCRQTLSTTTTKEEEEEEEEEEEWISSRTRCNKKSGKASTL